MKSIDREYNFHCYRVILIEVNCEDLVLNVMVEGVIFLLRFRGIQMYEGQLYSLRTLVVLFSTSWRIL
jgi:hypothetical protein